MHREMPPSACTALCTKRSSILKKRKPKPNHTLIVIYKDMTSEKGKTSEIAIPS